MQTQVKTICVFQITGSLNSKKKKKLDKNYKSLPTSLGNQNIKSMD